MSGWYPGKAFGLKKKSKSTEEDSGSKWYPGKNLGRANPHAEEDHTFPSKENTDRYASSSPASSSSSFPQAQQEAAESSDHLMMSVRRGKM